MLRVAESPDGFGFCRFWCLGYGMCPTLRSPIHCPISSHTNLRNASDHPLGINPRFIAPDRYTPPLSIAALVTNAWVFTCGGPPLKPVASGID